jgi:hypothetical protein
MRRLPINAARPAVSTPVNRPEDHMGIRLPCENAADRRGDVGGRQDRGRHLVQKRLEQVVVAPVDDGHIGRDLAELLRRG